MRMLVLLSLLVCGMTLIPFARATAAEFAHQESSGQPAMIEPALATGTAPSRTASVVLWPIQGPNCNDQVARAPQPRTELAALAPQMPDGIAANSAQTTAPVRHAVWIIRGSGHRHPMSTLLGVLMIGGASGRQH